MPRRDLPCVKTSVHEPFQNRSTHRLRAETSMRCVATDVVGIPHARTIGTAHVGTREVDVQLFGYLMRTTHAEVRIVASSGYYQLDVASRVGRPVFRCANACCVNVGHIHLCFLDHDFFLGGVPILPQKETTFVCTNEKDTTFMQHSDTIVMVTIGTSIRTIDAALARFRRSLTNDVLRAYAHIAMHAKIFDPNDHVSCIHSLSRGQGVAVVPRSEVEQLCNLLELGGSVDARDSCLCLDKDRFDPKMHALLCTEPTVVSYMEHNPDHILGACATVVAPTFKSALVWWTCE